METSKNDNFSYKRLLGFLFLFFTSKGEYSRLHRHINVIAIVEERFKISIYIMTKWPITKQTQITELACLLKFIL